MRCEECGRKDCCGSFLIEEHHRELERLKKLVKDAYEEAYDKGILDCVTAGNPKDIEKAWKESNAKEELEK